MSLRDLGFDVVQESVYRSLLADPLRDTATLASLTLTGETAVLAALDGLLGLGVVETSATAPCGYSPGDPEVVIGELIERLERETLLRQQKIGGTRAELAGLAAGFRHEAPTVEVEHITDPEQIRERLAELCFFTRSSVYSVQPARASSETARAEASRLDNRSLGRGVTMRIVYDEKLLRGERTRARLGERTASGAQIRFRQGPLSRLIVLDERIAVVPSDPADTSSGALVVRQPGIVSELVARFRQLWDGATDFAEPADVPSDEDRSVLRMLASGLTDEMVARQIGVSVRHLRRRIARLMDELGADSRFQAGMTAARRGWI
ncbi:LuxR C-terminal-related transcriptional regulator [Lentzea sp.]|uniref:LuxR C-terminal-related transcriptional regulator n=1 Tax=Lentzea sp. TaxID=56099 RepID=UPI002ED354AA